MSIELCELCELLSVVLIDTVVVVQSDCCVNRLSEKQNADVAEDLYWCALERKSNQICSIVLVVSTVLHVQ